MLLDGVGNLGDSLRDIACSLAEKLRITYLVAARKFIKNHRLVNRRNIMNALATREQSPVAQFSGFMDKLKPQLAKALPAHMNADRMARLALTAFSTNSQLQDCDMKSIAGSIMTAAQLGLEP